MKKVCLGLALSALACLCAGEKKIIDLSWSNPQVDFLAANVKAMEKDSPLDGITIRVWGTPRVVNGKTFVAGRNGTLGKIPWRYDEFKKTIETLKKIRFTRFKHNFFYLTTGGGDIDWFSDADAKASANNFAIAARIAKETGMKGILFDIEEYGKKCWRYNSLEVKQPYSLTKQMVRRRGQEIGKAMFREFPDMILFMPFMFSYKHALSLAFINGLLDVIPPGARIIEGEENAGYAAKRPGDYKDIRWCVERVRINDAAPENREKFRRQVELAPAFYMDAIFAHESRKGRYHKNLQPEINAGALQFFRRNLAAAVAETPEYIWCYSEKGAFWDHKYHKQMTATWEKRYPGVSQIMLGMKDHSLIKYSDAENLLKNGQFKEANKDWNFWQIENDRKVPAPGTGKVGNGICSMKGMTSGCFTQNIPVKPGDMLLYRVRYKFSPAGEGTAAFAIACRDAKGKWVNFNKNRSVNLPVTKDYKYSSMLFTVPEGTAALSVQLGGGCQGKNGEVIFSEALLIKL